MRFSKSFWLFLFVVAVVAIRYTWLAHQIGSTPPRRNETTFNPDWTSCRQMQECGVVKGVCDWEAINIRWYEAYERFCKSKRPLVECGPPQWEKMPQAVCENAKCQLKVQE